MTVSSATNAAKRIKSYAILLHKYKLIPDNIECQHDFGTSVPSRGAVRGPSTCGHDSNIVAASTSCHQSASMNVRAPITTTAWCHTAVTT
uniref:Uncharacterized protein n=1 Tax=Trichogramma kaykai TaxID=54128 RepID=A0ABD2WZU8_9HYME